jgi:hypothetical protein
MRFRLFALPYKVKPHPNTNPWQGWRVWWLGYDLLRPCEDWDLFPIEGEDCDCQCCKAAAPHRHTGFVRGDFPIGRDAWRKHWWSRKR